ncbi:MAG: Activator of Hsp90 ATPase 1 family protein [Marmoricola sp.]|nr:Activator of Hsp90 ATPase 1 family protein [Marmoricola sp.]
MTETLSFAFDLDCTPDHAFAMWTSRIDSWWPRDHTMHRAAAVVLQEGLGGRIFERDADGIEHDWGEVTAWEPPSRLAYTWRLGRSDLEATDVEVRFVAADAGATRVEIEQSGWERFGEEAGPWRDRNRISWDSLLPHFRTAIERNA